MADYTSCIAAAAVALRARGIDGGDVAIVLQLFPEHTVADAIPLGENLDGAALHRLLTHHSPGLAALIAPLSVKPLAPI